MPLRQPSILRRIHIRRVREIVAALYGVGLGLVVRRLQLQRHLPLRLRLMGRFRIPRSTKMTVEEAYALEREQLPRKLRLAMEELGPTFIKLGQLLSLRADVVGTPIANEFRKLQDQVPAMPFDRIRPYIEKELGRTIKSAFRSFDTKPIGSASIAQVYRATLHDGTKVAVKVLRPGVEDQMKEDIVILEWLAHLFEEQLPSALPFHPVRVVQEFADWTTRELNLLNEATNMVHFRKLLEDDEHFFIPNVFWKWTTSRVLVMEYSHGIHPNDHAALKKLHISQKTLAATGIRLAFRQFFEFGFFHGDPHPGNMFILKGGILCLHDFGIVGRISNATRRELIGCFLAFLDKDTDSAMKHLLHIALHNPKAQTARFKEEAETLLEQWFYAPTSGRRLSETFYEVIVIGAKYGIFFPSEVVLMAKAIITTESMALDLDPKFDIMKAWQPYLQKALLIEMQPKRLASRGRDAAVDTNALLDQVPEAVRRLVELAQEERLEIGLNTDEFKAIKSEIDRQTDIRLLSMLFVAVLLASSVLLHLEGVTRIFGIPLATVGVLTSIALGVVVLLKIRKGA